MRNKRIVSSLFIFLSISTTVAHAAPNTVLFEKLRRLKDSFEHSEKVFEGALSGNFNASQEKSIQTGYFYQKLDHFDLKNTTAFAQRYHVDSTYASGPNAPVFYVICGEGTCDTWTMNGLPTSLASQYKGYVVALEHRYYGASQPFKTLTRKNLRYLTTDFALKDLSYFQEKLTEKLGLTGPWVAIGGSYAGNLAAYYRLKYPTQVVGAVASSAPVKAIKNFEEYDHHAFLSIPRSCSSKIRNFISYAESAVKDEKAFQTLRTKLSVPDLDHVQSFLSFVSSIPEYSIQYGQGDWFCSQLEKGKPLEVYAYFAKAIKTETTSYAPQLEETGDPLWANAGVKKEKDEDNNAPEPINKANEGISWFYQTCGEYGYFQAAYHDINESIHSKAVDLDFFLDACVSYFGEEAREPSIVNGKYYYQLNQPTVTNIFFTNGSQDPWRVLSVLSNKDHPNLEASVLYNYAHCSDLNYYGPGSSEGDSQGKLRKRIVDSVARWIGTN
jgi:pimeloyl-ACP methyl ester carboxylesterase